jgi:hypothetical protein
MKNFSQSHQDVFALKYSKNKTYIEIGSHHPTKHSNTYNLETQGWKGIGIEFDKKFMPFWNEQTDRKNKIYWQDAMTFDYISALKEHNLSTRIGYLSCDIEPPAHTFKALRQVIEQGITFDCITFEHDKYQNLKKFKDTTDYESIATEYLQNKGYKIAVSNVYPKNKKKQIYETWFVHNDIETDLQIFKYEDWIKHIGIY